MNPQKWIYGLASRGSDGDSLEYIWFTTAYASLDQPNVLKVSRDPGSRRVARNPVSGITPHGFEIAELESARSPARDSRHMPGRNAREDYRLHDGSIV